MQDKVLASPSPGRSQEVSIQQPFNLSGCQGGRMGSQLLHKVISWSKNTGIRNDIVSGQWVTKRCRLSLLTNSALVI
jgi:hypothetical protein